jgi:hypothetical protein
MSMFPRVRLLLVLFLVGLGLVQGKGGGSGVDDDNVPGEVVSHNVTESMVPPIGITILSWVSEFFLALSHQQPLVVLLVLVGISILIVCIFYCLDAYANDALKDSLDDFTAEIKLNHKFK